MNPESLAMTFAACALAAGAVLSPGAAGPLTPEGPIIAPIELAPAVDPARTALVDYLSDRYQLHPRQVRVFVDEAYDAAKESGLDPLLVLAVIGVESGFNPAARSGFGATGLMQIVARFHRDRLVEHGGEAALLDPRVNVQVGTQILTDYLSRSRSVIAGLQRYAGWPDAERRYAHKVITEKERLQRVVQLASKDLHRAGNES